MTNADIPAAIQALAAVGATKIPMPLALRMAKLRRNLEEHLKAVDEVRVASWMDASGGAKEMKAGEPGIAVYQEANNELMAQDYATETFTLYSKGDEYAWSENFKTKLGEIETNTLYGLLACVEIVEVPSGAPAAAGAPDA